MESKQQKPLLVEVMPPSWKVIAIKFIFWGIVIGGILPLGTGLSLRYYDNQKTLNHYLITQSFPAMQEAYNKCANEYYNSITEYNTELGYLHFIDVVTLEHSQSTPNNLFISDRFFKTAKKQQAEIQAKINDYSHQVNLCLNAYFIEQNKTAALLGLDTNVKYKSVVQTYNKSIKKTNRHSLSELMRLAKKVKLRLSANGMIDWFVQQVSILEALKVQQDKKSLANGIYKASVSVTKINRSAAISKYMAFNNNYRKVAGIFYQAFRSQSRSFL